MRDVAPPTEKIDQAQYEERDLLPLSGLQHLVFCERQCALIHVERVWLENVLTAEGRLLHQLVDSGQDETRGDLRIVRSLPIRSLRLGLSGKADVVELRRIDPSIGTAPVGITLPRLDGQWQPVPVEYKRGEPKFMDCDRVQVCAQAICLEEMLHVRISRGYLFYGKRRRRFEVALDEVLRQKTEATAVRFHELVAQRRTPAAERQPKCRSCSLLQICLPSPPRRAHSATTYLKKRVDSILAEETAEDS